MRRKKFNSEKINTQGRPTVKNMVFNLLMACRQIEVATQTAGARVCKQQHEAWDSPPVRIQPGLFSPVHKDMLYKFAKQLPCLAHNSKVNEATGLAPFLVFMGREAKLPADMILPNQQEDFQNQGETVEHHLRNLDKIYDYLKGKEEIRIRRNSLRYSNQPALDKEDIVWYLSSKNVPNQPLKVTKSWTGPWVIDSRVYQCCTGSSLMIPAAYIQLSLYMWGG
ncbi:MAG: hypothetical protein GY696_07160 [Gammaproteobacteria bacterium]|nr:hypothetical protein [Gammaproteobacteria bacterium]